MPEWVESRTRFSDAKTHQMKDDTDLEMDDVIGWVYDPTVTSELKSSESAGFQPVHLL